MASNRVAPATRRCCERVACRAVHVRVNNNPSVSGRILTVAIDVEAERFRAQN